VAGLGHSEDISRTSRGRMVLDNLARADIGFVCAAVLCLMEHVFFLYDFPHFFSVY